MREANKHIFIKHFLDIMRLIYVVFILLQVVMTSAQCQQTAEDWIKEGDNAFNETHYYAAIDAYEEAIRIDPNNIEAWVGKGSAYSVAREPDKAIEAYETAIQLDPTCYKCWNNKGLVFLNQGSKELDMNTDDKGISKFEAAIDAFEEAIRVNSRNNIAWLNKGKALQYLSKYDAAIEAYDEAITLDPTDPVAWGDKGSALREQSKYNETIEAFNEAIRLDPSYKDYLGIYGPDDEVRHYFEQAERTAEQAKKALVLASYDEAIKQDPKNITAWFSKARTLLEWGQFKNATEVYDAASKSGCTNVTVWIKEGRYIAQIGQGYSNSKFHCEESIRCFDRAIKILEKSPNNATTWNNKGVALEYQAETDAFSYARETDSEKYIAHARYRTDKREQSLKSFEKAINLDPKCSIAWYNKGIILYVQDHEETREYYGKIDECFEQAKSLPYEETGCIRLNDRWSAEYQTKIKTFELRPTTSDVERVAPYT
jgi:tetratricopeptide (TPR) repeat protein